jgi:hypothetical protein
LLLKKQGGTRTELVRKAILHYLDCTVDAPEIERMHERDRLLVNSLKSIENRFAGLMVRLGIDVQTVIALLWAGAPKEQREQLFRECKKVGQSRFRRHLDNVEIEERRRMVKQPDELTGA